MNNANIFERPNPFNQSMRVMECPPDMGSITVDQFQLQPDDEHLVMVPEHLVSKLAPHGLMDVTAREMAKQQKAAKK